MAKVEGDLLKRYLRGEINDKTLLNTIKREKLGDLKKGGVSTYIIGTENYGSNLDSFVSALSGPEEEKETIKKYLSSVAESVVIRNGKTSEVLVHLWDDHWKELISFHSSKEVADNIREKPKNAPSQALSEARRVFISADVVASLPEFKRPGPITKLADTLAKAAKVGGGALVIKTMATETLRDTKYRSISAAFVLAADSTAEVPLHLTADEKDFVSYLIPFAKAVVDASGDKYSEAMSTLLTASGSGEKL
jgi:hypothetical protein